MDEDERGARRKGNTGRWLPALALAVWAAETPAYACQACTTIGLYDLLRFGVVWFYVLLIWIVLAAVADFHPFVGNRHSRPGGFFHSRYPVCLLGAYAVLSIALGLHFAALLALPVLLFPYCAPIRWLRDDRLRAKAVRAPNWLKRAAWGCAVVMLLSIIPCYTALPVMRNEAQTRSLASRVKNNMKSLSTMLTAGHERSGAYPKVIQVQDGDARYATLDAGALAMAATGAATNTEIENQLRDPFAFRAIPLPRWAGAALMFPRIPYPSLKPGDGFRRDSRMFPKMQYQATGGDFVLWSRGPDCRFSLTAPEAARVLGQAPDKRYLALIGATYDPTNGTTSPGDVFCFGP